MPGIVKCSACGSPVDIKIAGPFADAEIATAFCPACMPMSPILTDEQRQAIHEANDRGPVTVVDPATQVSYVLMRSDLYERCHALFTDEPFDVREAYPAMDAVAAQEGWLDPAMDAYDQLDPRKP